MSRETGSAAPEPLSCASCDAECAPREGEESVDLLVPLGWGLVYGTQPVCSVACALAYALDHGLGGKLRPNDVAWHGQPNEQPKVL